MKKKFICIIAILSVFLLSGCENIDKITCSKKVKELKDTDTVVAYFKKEKLTRLEGTIESIFKNKKKLNEYKVWLDLKKVLLESYGYTVSEKVTDKTIVLSYKVNAKKIKKDTIDLSSKTTKKAYLSFQKKDNYNCK